MRWTARRPGANSSVHKADSGFWTHQGAWYRSLPARWMSELLHRTLRQWTMRKTCGTAMSSEAIPEDAWTPSWPTGWTAPPMWQKIREAYIPFQSEPDAAPVRLPISPRPKVVSATPGVPDDKALFATSQLSSRASSPHLRWGGCWNWRPYHRRHAEIENAIRDLKYGDRD